MADPTNAAGNEERLDVSKVYYLPAGADVAASIGRLMGGVEVTRMPVPGVDHRRACRARRGDRGRDAR